ncbi:Glycosylphosphatidylinositol (GPI) anchor assembly protein [Malassezia cuniculi]|uniref:Glycosylphosphatidylinositol (GPI) anchor assembly protein n=1 Tax=Malassezia cuniculi TaxID=948313 RepID=A0AAF0J5Q1_9BASI|nr:Glycosylphosphatidylinositol (GPI) anchor assembly protein [Malassezia cuniculi]
MHHKHTGPGAWPALHVLQLVLSLGVLQPTLLIISIVDFTRLWPDGVVPWGLRSLVSFSSMLRRTRSGVSLAWDLTLALQNVLLVQLWTGARLSAWVKMAEGYELGEGTAALRKRRLSTREQLEGIVMTSATFPFLWLVALALILLAGAPLESAWGGTAALAAYLGLLSLFPVVHIMGFPPSAAWYRVLTSDGMLSRELIVLVPAMGAWLGAWLTSGALALDWGREWQAWPAPSVYGALAGVIMGNFIALTICLLRATAARTSP